MEVSISTLLVRSEETIDKIKREFVIGFDNSKDNIVTLVSSLEYVASQLKKRVNSDEFKSCSGDELINLYNERS